MRFSHLTNFILYSAKRKRKCERPAGDRKASVDLIGMTRMTAGADVNKKGKFCGFGPALLLRDIKMFLLLLSLELQKHIESSKTCLLSFRGELTHDLLHSPNS